MKTNQNSKHEHIKAIIYSLKNEKLHIEKIFSHDYYMGVAIVRNNKLAGRLEDIKFLQSYEPNTRQNFLKEAKVLSAMQHGNIARIYDLVEQEDMLLFRSEHIEGYSLKEVLDALKEKNKEFPKVCAASIIFKLMNALYYAHKEVIYEGKKRSIVHCDIKPSNIILAAKKYKRKKKVDNAFLEFLNQNKVEPYLIDFGIAKFIGETGKEEGTLQYMSPAMIKSQSEDYKLDWRTDTYQLLLVYYEMLTGKKAYSGLSKKGIIEEKLSRDFQISKESISKSIKEFIEKGTRRNPANSFKSEKECIKVFSKIESKEKLNEIWRKYKTPVISISFILLIALIFIAGFFILDYYIQSTDAIIQKIEKNPNPSIEELELAVSRIQKRGFEKKYYLPLIKGEFRDKKIGTPLYPSHLDTEGNWVLVGPNDDNAGIFTGLLFEYSDKYPKLLEYAKEYAEPILNSEFDGTSENRFQYAFIPGYEKTKDERYLKKLINITDTLIVFFDMRKGTIQCSDMYLGRLFLFVYNQTENKKYLDAYETYVRDFVSNNIDSDGYIYQYASSNATTPYGFIPDDKANIIVVPTESFDIGNFYMLSSNSENNFKEITSSFTRDFLETLIMLEKMHKLTNDTYYETASSKAFGYYKSEMSINEVDFLFISKFNKKKDIPKDAFASLKAMSIFKEKNKGLYYLKLKALLFSGYFRKEKEAGVLSGNILIEGINYVHSDKNNKNQTLIAADAFFLKL